MQLRTCVGVVVLIILCAAVYRVAENVDTKEKELRRADAVIAKEEEALRVLTAEWTYLTNPMRLEKLATSYLNLAPVDGRQYIAVSAIPLRHTFESAAIDHETDARNVSHVVQDGAP